jgi:hypothetical protein
MAQQEQPGAQGHVHAFLALAIPQDRRPLGIVGAIEIECSPWLEDNQWVLDVAKTTTSWWAPWGT